MLASLALTNAGADARQNALFDHPSPYLAMHGQDPVQWREWGEQALAEARRDNRLLLVSSGYYTCYWCHVLHEESFSDPGIARLMNRFVPVKVDRELNPALDAMLIDFVERTRGQAGWPLNVFITPEGYPLVGFVYLPRDRLQQVLIEVGDNWRKDHARLKEAARVAFGLMHPERDDVPEPEPGKPAVQDLRAALVRQSMAYADVLDGGFGEQHKFPQVPQLRALLLAWRQEPADELRDFLQLTLDRMASGGLRDHIGGGFFRYSTDPGWRVPHFEKMLYDNAQLAQLYLEAAASFDRPRYAEVATDTLDFMLDYMRPGQGSMLAALSSVDDAGNEGGYYLWRAAETEALLSRRDLQVARLAWRLEDGPRVEGAHLPVAGATDAEIARQLGIDVAEVAASRSRALQALREARKARGLPADGKRIAGWNGLALSALAAAVRYTGEERYRRAGQAMKDFLSRRVWDGRLLARALGPQGLMGAASLEDYAYVARGLLDWQKAGGDAGPAGAIIRRAWRDFYGDGGWRLGRDPLLPYDLREQLTGDGPMPSPADVLIDATLEYMAADTELHGHAVTALSAGQAPVLDAPFANATRIAVMIRHLSGAAGE